MSLVLPIDAHLNDILASVHAGPFTIIKAAPGTGKTTRVPPALMARISGRILVLEPRRLAAKLSAIRIASELGEEPGKTCGYQVRYEGQSSRETRILFVTEGLFIQMLLDSPDLRGVEAVIIDEFHERHLQTDLALAMVRRLIATNRPDLKLIVMSATIDTSALETYLSGANILQIDGQTYPVTVEHRVRPGDSEIPSSGRVLETQIVNAIEQLLVDNRCNGNILVFSSGIQEIRRVEAELCRRGHQRHNLILPLTADLPPAEQAKVFATSSQRKIIIATNVAETSVTIPEITGVIDPGFAKIAGHASWSGMPTLDIRKISQSSAIQRAGRAGRTAPGIAYRLYSESDFLARPAYSTPDIRRLDLADIYLNVKVILQPTNQANLPLDKALPWLEPPDPKAVTNAQNVLTMLGALDDNGALTEIGHKLAYLPLGPRLGALIICGNTLGLGDLAILAAVFMSERLLPIKRERSPRSHHCDLLATMESLHELDAGSRRRIEQSYASIARKLQIPSKLPRVENLNEEIVNRFKVMLLAGFPDRIAKRREGGSNTRKDAETSHHYNLCLGRGALLSGASLVKDAEWLIALDASESVIGRSADRSTLIHCASYVSPDLLSLAPGNLTSRRKEVIWEDDSQRVDTYESVFYGQLCVSRDRTRIEEGDSTLIEELLRNKLQERWPKPFSDDLDLTTYHARLDFLRKSGIECNLPEFTGDMFDLLLASICYGKRSFKEIAARQLADYINDQLSYDDASHLEKLAPISITNRVGRKLKIHYDFEKSPWIQGMIQDFYGIPDTPKLLDSRIAVTISLMAPNKRPIQVTSDLRGFWQNSYPDIKRELSRRYPRHYWPDDPVQALPHLHSSRR